MIIKQLKKFKHTKLWATSINIVLILIAVNLIIRFFPYSFDFTTNQAHSLSTATKKTLNQVDDLVTIKAYISSNLPPQLLPLKETITNTLNQYDQTGGRKVKVILKDPEKDQQAESEVRSLGIAPKQFSSIQKDQYKLVQGYFGLAIFYSGKKEIIPALQEISNLEYRLTTAIKNLQKDQLAKIGFITGSGETNLAQLPYLQKALQTNYQTKQVDLTADDINTDDTQTLVMIGPKKELTEEVLKKLDAFLMEGKGLILLIDKIQVNQNLIPQKIDLNINDWIKHYGFEIEPKLIIDPSSAIANFRSQQGRFITPYPFWIKTRTENANQDLPITASLESAVFPWASPLKLTEETNFLWQTTSKATTVDDYNQLSPNQKWDFKSDSKQYNLAGIQLNEKSSFFNKENKAKIRLAIVSDTDFVIDQTTSSNPENLEFFLNLVDYLSQDNDLIEIRSKPVSSRPLKQISEHQKQTYKVASFVAGPAVLLLLAGLVRWQRKRINNEIV